MIKGGSEIPLVLFAKAPVAGKVKTRLTTHCSQQQAAAIAEILLKESLTNAVRNWPGKVYLSIWQFDQHPFIVEMLEKFSVELLLQAEGDLGEKMQTTFDHLGYPAAIMGCDAPLVQAASFLRAHSELTEGRNFIGPSEDGGYYMIGASKSIAPVFDNVSWGSKFVLQETLDLATRNNIKLSMLQESFDIDHWDDVLRASAKITALQNYLRAQEILN